MRLSIAIMGVSVLLALVSCSTQETMKQARDERSYRLLAESKYGTGFEELLNPSGTAVVCLKASKPTQLQPQQQIAFFVYDLQTKSLLFEDSIPNGSVRWKDSVSVMVNLVPGTVRDEEQPPFVRLGYIFDLRTRKTRDLNAVDGR
jgi:hypothetical protein